MPAEPNPRPAPPDPRLYNHDLAPAEKRTWGAYSVFALWMSDTHAISNYTFAAGLFVLGLPAWEVFLALLAGICVVCWLTNRMGHAGHRTGVPFPVLARASFGIWGANIPALIRAVMAVAWYGIQTWLASRAMVLLAVQIAPGIAAYDENDVLGLSTLGWIAFLVMWAVQLAVLSRGMEFIRKFQDRAAGPVVWVIMLGLAVWLLVKGGSSVSLTTSLRDLDAGAQFRESLAAVGLTVATFLTLVLNYADFARFSDTHRSYRRGNFLGLPVNFSAFALVSVLMTAGTIAVFGSTVSDPVEVVRRIDNPVVTVVGALTFIIATIGINVVANFVSPAYDFANLAPKRLDFKRGGLITALLAIAVMPWKLYSSPVVINYFLGGLAAFLGPLVAILLVDYYLVRRGRIDVDALFRADKDGPYYYRSGVNPRALAAFVPAAALSAVLALLPLFSPVAPFAWVAGMLIGGAVYYAISPAVVPRGEPLADAMIMSALTGGPAEAEDRPMAVTAGPPVPVDAGPGKGTATGESAP